MILEYLEDGSRNAPLVRIYAFTEDEACTLLAAARSLTAHEVDVARVHQLPGVASIDGIALSFIADRHDRGVVGTFPGFACRLTPSGWDNVCGLIEPFTGPRPTGYQWLTGWLDGSSETRLLISRDGTW